MAQAPDGTELERLSEPQDLLYDGAAIATQLHPSERMEAAWKNWFRDEQIDPLRMTYDALPAGPYALLARFLTALGLHDMLKIDTTPSLAKLADATSHTRAKQFLSEIHD